MGPSLKATIFDQDGTLLDTEGLQWTGWKVALKKYGVNLSLKEYLNYAGKTGAKVEKEIIENCHLDVREGELLKEKVRLLMKWLNGEKIRPMPYALDTIDFFRKKALKIAIASGGSRAEVELKLKRTGISHLFDAISTRSEAINGKPAPDIYLNAAKALGISPENCIAFEDTMYGVQSAKAAGMKCFAIPNKYTRKQDFSLADGVFRDLREAARAVFENK